MAIDIAVVPVAGRGTRLLPLTKSQPKEMLPVGRKPVVQYVVEELARCDVKRMLFITGEGKSAIENHFDVNEELLNHLRATHKEDLLPELAFERADVDYFFTRQRRQLGLGHAVLCSKPFVGNEPFVVALGDSIIGMHAKSENVKFMVEQFEADPEVMGVIAFEEVAPEEVVNFGIAKPDDESACVFNLTDIVEKPSVEEAPSQLAVAARYVFDAEIFDYLERTQPGKGDEIQLTDAIREMIADGKKFLGVRLRLDEPRYDIGNYDSYFQSFVQFALEDPEYGESLRQWLKEIL